MKKLTRPQMKIGKFVLRYKQHPYYDRFLHVNYSDQHGRLVEIMKISQLHMQRLSQNILAFINEDNSHDFNEAQTAELFYNFVDRIQEYDSHLDSMA